MSLQVNSADLKIIQSILHKDLPQKAKVWVFGSRAKETKKKFADLDLAIDLEGEKISLGLLAELHEDFDESDLPYKVDILDVNSTDPDFLTIIESDKIPLQF